MVGTAVDIRKRTDWNGKVTRLTLSLPYTRWQDTTWTPRTIYHAIHDPNDTPI